MTTVKIARGGRCQRKERKKSEKKKKKGRMKGGRAAPVKLCARKESGKKRERGERKEAVTPISQQTTLGPY